jgi:ABC-type antimicrobial peptide transport system permease subunit
MQLIGGFAATAALLALIGIYGVVSYTVRERTQEIGLRVALGASTGSSVLFVLWEGLTLTLGGIVVGVTGALLTSRILDGLLFGVSSTDPLTYGGLALVLTVAAGIACSVPAYRASAVDPIAALRLE